MLFYYFNKCWLIYLCVEVLFELFQLNLTVISVVTLTMIWNFPGENGTVIHEECSRKTNRWDLMSLTLSWVTYNKKGTYPRLLFYEVQFYIWLFDKDVQARPTARHLPVDYRLPEGGEDVQLQAHTSQRILAESLMSQGWSNRPKVDCTPWVRLVRLTFCNNYPGHFTTALLRMSFFTGNVQICYVQSFLFHLCIYKCG